MMKRVFFHFAIIVFLLSVSAFAQLPKPTPKDGKSNLTKPKTTKPVLKENDEFEKAVALTDLNEKVQALQKFIVDFPNSTKKNEALEIIFSVRAVWADEKIKAGELEAGIQLFKDALNETPSPISEGLFANVILPFPNKIFFIGQQAEALKIANTIESKIGDNPKLLIGLAAFYLGIESANQAKSVADAAIALDGNMPAAYQTLGLAYRLKFELEESEKAYAKALELAPDSIVSKRGLAEAKHSVGKPEEAVLLYRELIEKDPNDITSENGLILSLFDSGKREEAETLLNKSLEVNPKNLILLVGAAYWYAGHNEGAKAVDLGQKAVDLQPRYVWGRIALARGFMVQNQPFEAEKVLLIAQKYGSFPSLDYELATARFQAGLFEEAARELRKRFAYKDNYVQTYIAGRKDVAREAQSFTELLGLERRASIFMSVSADIADEAEKLKHLLDFSQQLSKKDATDEEINKVVDEFIKGDDKLKTHRQIYAANRLLDAKKSLPKVMELTQGAVKGVDNSLDINSPVAYVLADALLETRTLSISKDEIVIIPEIPRQTLSRIMRGRIEEIAGWTLYQQEKPQEAIVRLKRAVSILPGNSSWWRSSYWRLGLALDADGKSKESLEALVKSYLDGPPDRFRRGLIEGIYRKVNGNTDGLDKLIGANPFEEIAQVTPTPIAETSPSPTPTVENTTAEISPTPTPEPKTEPTPTPETKSETPTQPKPEPSPTPKNIFESVVIEVGKTKPTPTPTPAENKEENKEAEKTAENSGKTDEKQAKSLERLRVVTETPAETSSSCVVVNHESISILSNGGNLGILVGLNQDGDAKKIVAESSSPTDISISLEPDIGKQSNRAFFVVKSVSEKKGIYTVTFTSPCGKKEIQVKVR